MSARAAIIGARGRMGQRLIALASERDLTVAAEVDAEGPALDAALADTIDVVIDFSTTAQAPATAEFCRSFALPLVIGTTGLGDPEHAALDAAATASPVVWAPNFSVGINALATLVERAARLLGERFDIEIVEAHHRRKVDAPSGTARALAQRAAAGRGWDLDEVARYGREGLVGPRPTDELGISSLRGGSVIGEHQVLYLGEGESLRLEHRALDRDIFARGALRAAAWTLAPGRLPGRYTMGEVLMGEAPRAG